MRSKTSQRITIVILVALLAVSSVTSRADMTTGAAESEKGDAFIIGHLEMRELNVTIHGGELGTYYTVYSKDGAMLADRITQAQLKSSFSDVHERIDGGMAGLLALW